MAAGKLSSKYHCLLATGKLLLELRVGHPCLSNER
jgi:hypothetical protein